MIRVMASFTHFVRNGEVLPIAEASVSLTSIEYSYGFGVYETIRVSSSAPQFLDEHIKRLFKSAAIIGLEHVLTEGMITKWVSDLLEKCGAPRSRKPLHLNESLDESRGIRRSSQKRTKAGEGERYNLKMLLIGAIDPNDAQLIILPLNPLFPDKKFVKEGVDVITYEYARPFPNAKTLNMLNSYLAYKKAKEAGCFEALFTHPDGNIYEGTRSNLFMVKGKTLITPPSGHILEGITRDHVIELAKKEGIEVKEADIPLSETKNFDGAFLTSSAFKVMPIKKIDDIEFGEIPEVTKKVIELYG